MQVGEMVGAFVGGVGLFLLGMHLMTDGLKVAAGHRLRDTLARRTRTPLSGLFYGALVTGAVQSSSAVTVAAIGFVNAGLLELRQAVWVVFGSNVGTTVTGWIVAVTGVDIDIEAFALPLIGIGMLLRLTGSHRRRGAIGEAVAGFGLFFLGLGFLQSAFGSVSEVIDPGGLDVAGPLGSLAFFGIGALLTVATQSSSAALALTLTAATTGVIDLDAAGAMVIGANLGTTSTALVASLGATPNARRVALAHTAFNLLAALVALVLLPWMLDAVMFGLTEATGAASVAVALALFHTLFNVLGVLLMWPLSGRLLRFLERCFATPEEDAGRPAHLDPTVLSVPSVALEALRLEASRVGHLAAEMLALSAARPPVDQTAIERRREAFGCLMSAVAAYMRRLDRSQMPAEVATGLQALVRATQHYLIAAEQAELVAHLRGQHVQDASSVTLARYFEAVQAATRGADPSVSAFSLESAADAFGRLQQRYDQAYAQLTEDAATGSRDPALVLARQHVMAEARRGAKHLVRASEDLMGHLPATLRLSTEADSPSLERQSV